MSRTFNYVTNFNSLSYISKLDCRFLSSLPLNWKNLIKERRLRFLPFSSHELIELSVFLEEFLLKYFKCDIEAYKTKFSSAQKVNFVKRNFIQRTIAVNFKNFDNISSEKIYKFISEEDFAEKVLFNANDELLINYARFALFTEDGQKKHAGGTLFKTIKKVSLPFISRQDGEALLYNGGQLNFHKSRSEAFWETQYCIYCHPQEKDYCRKGNPVVKKGGCPLNQKISEMNYAKGKGGIIAPLAILMVDNPLCLLTGERICNDCKKACIFQKQEGVDVPAIESLVLKDVLDLPFGFEIYTLLTKWNPMLASGFLPKALNGKKVLVCGSGPAGIAACFYALREGFHVTLADGLHILPVPSNFLKDSIKHISEILNNSAAERLNCGFGGVMKYGITDRWNKNFLFLAQILLERWKKFNVYGGLRFGSNITEDIAKSHGFDHVFLCTGAGKPKFLEIEGSHLEGVITASNFLMSAHIGSKNIGKLLQEPIAVIGGGLTAVDAASEASKYGKTLLFYRKEMQHSKAFILNDMEVKEAMSKNIQFFENKDPQQILSDAGRVSGILFSDGSKMEVKTIIMAIGTEKQEWENSSFITKFGDLEENYEGSVVKAIASVKDRYAAILPYINSKASGRRKLFYHIWKIEQEFGLLKLTIRYPVKIKARPLNIFKFQTLNRNSRSLPLTLFEIYDRNLVFYVKKNLLPDIRQGDRISLMQAIDNLKNVPSFSNFVVEDESFFQVFSKIFKTKIILLKNFKPGSSLPTLFYIKDYKKVPLADNNFIFLLNEMQCMLGGVCSRCVMYTSDMVPYFSCSGNIINSLSIR